MAIAGYLWAVIRFLLVPIRWAYQEFCRKTGESLTKRAPTFSRYRAKAWMKVSAIQGSQKPSFIAANSLHWSGPWSQISPRQVHLGMSCFSLPNSLTSKTFLLKRLKTQLNFNSLMKEAGPANVSEISSDDHIHLYLPWSNDERE